MNILAIDPGPLRSAYVVYDVYTSCICEFHLASNADLLARLRATPAVDVVVIEKVASYGMAVGESVFETVYWSGRFTEAAHPLAVDRITRLQVKLALCHDSRAKDANIRAALIDRYGGQAIAIGNKQTPGPLYGVSKDVWSALAVAVAWADENGLRGS